MTATEENTSTDEATEAEPTAVSTVKYPTYAELAKAAWKLAFGLSSRGSGDTSRDYCTNGTSTFLERLELPGLGNVESLDQADSYLDGWLAFTHWRATGELSPEDDEWLRNRLATRLRDTLRHDEPSSRDVMNSWLVELGLEPIAPPPPPRHTGRYDVSYNESTEVNSARIQEALRTLFPTLNVEVSYVGRRY